MNLFDALPFMLFITIPLVAILGGFTMGIVRTLSRQRLLELAQKERITAIERGVDPAKLPPITLPEGMRGRKNDLTFEQRALQRSHGLMIAGIVMTAFGLATTAMITVMEPSPESWAPGMIFVFTGIALMISSRVGRPSAEDVRRSVEERKRSTESTPSSTI
jgi:hypothetical protein